MFAMTDAEVARGVAHDPARHWSPLLRSGVDVAAVIASSLPPNH